MLLFCQPHLSTAFNQPIQDKYWWRVGSEANASQSTQPCTNLHGDVKSQLCHLNICYPLPLQLTMVDKPTLDITTINTPADRPSRDWTLMYKTPSSSYLLSTSVRFLVNFLTSMFIRCHCCRCNILIGNEFIVIWTDDDKHISLNVDYNVPTSTALAFFSTNQKGKHFLWVRNQRRIYWKRTLNSAIQ